MMDTLSQWGMETLETYAPKLIAAGATLVLGWIAAKLLRLALRGTLRGVRLDATASTFCVNLVYITSMALVGITAMSQLGMPTVSFAAVLGAAGLAIGLALKGTLSNFAAGVILIALRPFKVGDRIDTAGVNGTVSKIHVFATTLLADGGRRIIVPNASMIGGNITNHSTA